jgi:predicted dehydrogenase
MDRRNFVRTSVLTGAGMYLATSKTATAQAISTDKVLKVALVGCGAQGERLLLSSKDIPGIQYVAAVDIWSFKRVQIARRIKYAYGSCNEYTDIEEMLAKEKDLDCVLIATPDFLHAPYTRLALQAGKMVYCEKMMSNTLDAARDMVKAQRETGGILQIGHQRHSNPRYHNVRDNILNGSKLLGRDPSAGSSSSGLGKGGAGQWRQASKFCSGMAVGRCRPYRRIGSKGPSIQGA